MFQGKEGILNRGKVIVLVFLLLLCIIITYYFHFVERTNVAFTHFFYVPISLAGFWWGRRAVWVAAYLSGLLIISYSISGLDVSYTLELLRIGMFFVVSIVVGTLVEQLKTEEQELQSSEEKYRSLVESTEDLIYLVDRDCRYLFINSQHLSRFGSTKDRL